MPDGRLEGQVAVVTGAGSGIGRACAIALAVAGARVALAGRRRDALRQTARKIPRGAAKVLPTDVTRPKRVEKLFGAVREAWGPVDILVNNAGLNTRRRTIAEILPEDWERVVAVNLTGVYLCTRAVLPAMRGRGGTIINIGSLSGLRATVGGGIGYCAAKYGITGFTHALNIEENPHGVRATAIHPGEVDTPILNKRREPPTKARRKLILRPEDVAQAVVFIATRPPGVHVPEMAIKPISQRFD